ncbi:hypothetical protein LOTGIDRAFT_171848 [Lottia gigantea]|uniref:CUB domain-containing protein n=1 Tax=Lottia gigantea TaxID=225164 RepID=V4AYG8_LOTGI|nr:hypothetical protein LOTGIDRAFT_171848 [Lottia gigantea]ESP02648.1 hypothetical protein LOTGIDRAFT_171848 [Lottia gigantea]
MMKTLLSVPLYLLLLDGVSSTSVLLTATATPQYFTSPNYPSNYPSNVDDTIRIISSRPDWKVAIEFTDFRLESSSSCTYDKLKIYDGEPIYSSLEGTHCGYNEPDHLFSSSNKASMVFKTDSSGQYKGFRFKYFASEDYPFEDDSVLRSTLILYICLGVFIPIGAILFLIFIVFLCYHAGKSKRTRVADMRIGQQNMRAQMINAHHVQGGHHVIPVHTISGPSAPMQQQPPMYAPPPYDTMDYSTSGVPPPFNYLDPDSSHDKNQRLFSF